MRLRTALLILRSLSFFFASALIAVIIVLCICALVALPLLFVRRAYVPFRDGLSDPSAQSVRSELEACYSECREKHPN